MTQKKVSVSQIFSTIFVVFVVQFIFYSVVPAYQNENDMIMKNSRVIVKRVVRTSSAPLRAQ